MAKKLLIAVVLLVLFSAAALGTSAANTANITNASCARIYECRPAGGGDFWFDCHIDKTSTCRCYTGKIDACNVSRSSLTLNELCSLKYECGRRRDGKYWINCTYSNADTGCRCYASKSSCALVNQTLTSSPVFVADYERGNILRSALNSGFTAARWLFTNRPAGIAAVVLVISIVLLFYFSNRDSAGNNLRKARAYHRKGERLHKKGKEAKAAKYYELARLSRERMS